MTISQTTIYGNKAACLDGLLMFVFRLIGEAIVGRHPAVIPTVTGQAWITQYSEVVVDPEDPVPDGYTLGDIWA